MVPNIEHRFTADLHHPLKVREVSALVYFSALESGSHSMGSVARLGFVDFLKGCATGEEEGFASTGEDDVKIVFPGGVFRDGVVQEVTHDGLRIAMRGVGEQKEFFPSGAKLMECGAQLQVFINIVRNVFENNVFERTIPVDGVDGFSNVRAEFGIIHRLFLLHAEHFNNVCKQAGFGKRKKGIHPSITGMGRREGAHSFVAVEAFIFLAVQRCASMHGSADVAEAIHFDEVAVGFVDEESADGKVRTIRNAQNVRWIAIAVDKLLQSQLKRKLFNPPLVIDGQGIVHVKTHQLNGGHAQVSVDENLSRALHVERSSLPHGHFFGKEFSGLGLDFLCEAAVNGPVDTSM